MAFYTGTITGGGSAGLQTKLEECLTAESANWEFVEEASVSTVIYRIWKNKGHTWNGGNPFYIYLNRYSTSSLIIRPFEEWDSVNKRCVGMIASTSSGTVTLDSLGRIAATNPVSSSIGCVSLAYLPTAATVYTYYIAVYPEGIFINTTCEPKGGYVGLFEPSGIISENEFPLIIHQHESTPVYRVSRLPGLTGSWSVSYMEPSQENDGLGSIPTGVAQLGGKSVLARRKIKQDGINRGYMPDWYLASAAPTAGVVSGDTITIGGIVYTYCKTNSHHWIR